MKIEMLLVMVIALTVYNVYMFAQQELTLEMGHN